MSLSPLFYLIITQQPIFANILQEKEDNRDFLDLDTEIMLMIPVSEKNFGCCL